MSIGTDNAIEPGVTAALQRIRRRDTATHWQLMWWKFKKHRMALVGVSILAVFLVACVIPEFLAPYGPQERNKRYAKAAPMGVHFIDSEGKFHLRPFAYGRTSKRDPVTFRLFTTVDETKIWPIQFFVSGAQYNFFGLIETDLHLFGTEKGFLHLFGTDQVGRDVFSRAIYATRVSLSIGAIGVAIAFTLGLVIGGIAGYLGGIADIVIMRIVEFIRSVPTLPLWLALAAALPREWTPLEIYIAITVILAMIGWTHLALLGLALLTLPITPSETWKPEAGDDPTWHILLLLLSAVGAPFLVLSATGPLRPFLCQSEKNVSLILKKVFFYGLRVGA